MGACNQYEDTLMLDVYGELDSKARIPWEAHLQACPACLAERAALLRLLGTVRKCTQAPPLHRAWKEVMVKAVHAGLRDQERKTKWLGWFGFPHPTRLVPAMAVLCMVIIAVYVLGVKNPHSPLPGRSTAQQKTLTEIQPADMEILKHLDLLRDLDSVQRLVNIMDGADKDGAQPRSENKVQGLNQDEKQEIYA